MDFVLYEGREQIAVAAQPDAADPRPLQDGISISKVTMQNAQPPEQVQAAFDDAVRAKQDSERQKNEGQRIFNDGRSQGARTARALDRGSHGTARRIAEREGEASRFRQILVEYNKAPAVTRERSLLDTIQAVLSSAAKILIDAKAGVAICSIFPSTRSSRCPRRQRCREGQRRRRRPAVTDPRPRRIPAPAPATRCAGASGGNARDQAAPESPSRSPRRDRARGLVRGFTAISVSGPSCSSSARSRKLIDEARPYFKIPLIQNVPAISTSGS